MSLPKKADHKHPGYIVMIAPTNCKDCDCAQRLVRCQNATAVEQHPTIFAQPKRSEAKLLTKDEARRIAANIAKLPELLQ